MQQELKSKSGCKPLGDSACINLNDFEEQLAAFFIKAAFFILLPPLPPIGSSIAEWTRATTIVIIAAGARAARTA